MVLEKQLFDLSSIKSFPICRTIEVRQIGLRLSLYFLTAFYKNPVLFPRTTWAKNIKGNRFLPTNHNQRYHGAFNEE